MIRLENSWPFGETCFSLRVYITPGDPHLRQFVYQWFVEGVDGFEEVVSGTTEPQYLHDWG